MISLQRKILRLQEVGVIVVIFENPYQKGSKETDYFFQRQRMTFY